MAPPNDPQWPADDHDGTDRTYEMPIQQPQQLPVLPAVVHAQPMRIEPSGEQHPATAVTPGGEQPPPPQPPRKRRRGLLIGALVLVVLLLGGTAYAATLPAVSNRLGLPWAPNAPKGDPPGPVPVSRVLAPPGPSAPSPTADGVRSALAGVAGSSALGTLTGAVIDPATGKVLWERDGGKPLTPASTTKVLTAAAALLALDHTSQLSTKVVQGSEPGTVVLVAGGDVTLTSLPDGKESLYPGAAHLSELVAQVKAAGVDVERVQLDTSLFTGAKTAPGWAPEDAPSTYMAPVEPVMLDGGRGNPAEFKSQRLANPAATMLGKLADALGARAAGQGKAPEGAKVLGEVKSAPLTELVDILLTQSDNLIADVVGRLVAIKAGAEPSFAGGAKATLEVLRQNQFDVGDVELSDGSGLSTLNKVPARTLAQVLSVAAAPDGKDPRTAKLRPLLGGLPVAAGSGTLADRYTSGASADGKGWVRAKTGTLSGVNTLAGVVLDKDGHVLVFALMSAGSELKAGQGALDAVAAKLRGCGCR
ncbi:D-alanyl-D-alanine carboxypeptidase/D-alanyl-D-alanine-endopeptidase [Amycolatopsis suaedae]|uniref:D-alanyl-D-alanine carboxypeptidase/D-alanyl-D-alanine-endopeptidase n=1 Tax=Amycolatopsis suaedae TaxID=2510978 RepID=A0A4Q7J4N4_9PSEU|nr:D-alanyl-D-alanine carboxypeptidase/D-alanyl-D-alanine-endopeptidase [Amycolatopsis suaedae]RZQ61632.1 D-alanyl-D-alanine carboxypeptidase/D-alanyl-D-alanine-endopeptidase [Amycolatopsis suaedae]